MAATTSAPAAEEWKGGELVFAGGTDWAMLGKTGGKMKKNPKEDAEREALYPNLVAPHRIKSLMGVRIMFVAGGAAAVHAICGDSEGRVYTWGRNDKGQLGHGDLCNRNVPAIVEGLKGHNVTGASGGRHHSVVFTSGGDSYAFGSNNMGQCGTGSCKAKAKVEDLQLRPVKALVSGVSSVSCGVDFTMWLAGGQLLAAGSGQSGQLGDGSNHEYNAKDSSIQMVVEPQPTPKAVGGPLAGKTVVRVSCGQAHTLALDSEGSLYTWGNGGYGRLGHKVQQDEFRPRKVEFFSGRYTVPKPHEAVITGSQTGSFCSGVSGQMYVWGKVKANGDSQTHPTPLQDLSGWVVRSMACGPSTFVVAADKSAITWGQATNGELGYGANGKKSSANPVKVDALEGLTTHSVAAGLGFSLFLLDSGAAAEAQLAKLPVHETEAPPVEAGPAVAGEEEADAGGKGGAKGGKRGKAAAAAPAAKRAKK